MRPLLAEALEHPDGSEAEAQALDHCSAAAIRLAATITATSYQLPDGAPLARLIVAQDAAHVADEAFGWPMDGTAARVSAALDLLTLAVEGEL